MRRSCESSMTPRRRTKDGGWHGHHPPTTYLRHFWMGSLFQKIVNPCRPPAKFSHNTYRGRTSGFGARVVPVIVVVVVVVCAPPMERCWQCGGDDLGSEAQGIGGRWYRLHPELPRLNPRCLGTQPTTIRCSEPALRVGMSRLYHFVKRISLSSLTSNSLFEETSTL